jgi:hypothetical protein
MTPHKRNSPARLARAALRQSLKPPRPPRPPRVRNQQNRVWSESIAHNTERQCDAAGCFKTRRNIGRYCMQHENQFRMSGHPLVRNIGITKWRPYVRDAEDFVYFHLRNNHPSIAQAVRWIDAELRAAEKPRRRSRPVGR